ncbi:MAG TPA: hypothetical protein VHD62_19765 [Opitutaceae bacterium]|nr:hypothetical protein [Opitutaceae bacterium]
MNSSASPHRNSPLVPVLSVIAVLAVGFAVFEFTSAQKAEDSLAAATRLHQADLARQEDLTQKAAAAEQAQAQLKTQLAEQRAAVEAAQASQAAQAARVARPSANPADNPAAAARKRAQEDGQAFMAMFETQVRPLLMNIGRAQIERNFSNLIRSGKLTPAQIEALEAATAEHWINTIEVTPGSIHPGDPNLKDEDLRRVLGDEGFKSFEEARRLQPLQSAVSDISSMSVFVPLTPEQSKQLLQVVASATPAYQTGGRVTPQSIDWEQVIAQSQSFLSEPQLNAVKAEAQLPQVMALIKQFYQAQSPTAK